MSWRKLTDEEVSSFDSALPNDRRVEHAKMFGLPHGKVNGNMFTGRHADGVAVRLPESEREALRAKGARTFEPLKGRPMKEWVLLPAPLADDAKKLQKIIRQAFEYGLTLPPKTPKAKATGKKANGSSNPVPAASPGRRKKIHAK